MSRTKVISAAVASFGLMGFAAATQADTAISPGSTTYEYTSASSINFQNGSTAQAMHESTLIGTFGNGVLNDGLVGNQAYLDTTSGGNNIGNSGDGNFGGSQSYNDEGGPTDSTPLGGSNAPGQALNQGIYYGAPTTMVFNLGHSYSNLSTVTINETLDGTTNWSDFGQVIITDSSSDTVTDSTLLDNSSNLPGGATAGEAAFPHGWYFNSTIDISGLSGQFITLAFSNIPASWAPIDEIDFATTSVPEPASLGLLGIGGLALLRHRAKRRAL